MSEGIDGPNWTVENIALKGASVGKFKGSYSTPLTIILGVAPSLTASPSVS